MSKQVTDLNSGCVESMVNERPPLRPWVNLEDESNYCYIPLDGEDAIRLVIIQPAEDTSRPVQCEIIGTRLSSLSQPFTALSYAWGDATNTKPIFIRSSRLFIGCNLHDALVHLRKNDESICVWVDAICINQRDLSERNHQVQQMRRIYSSGHQTIIYLGNESGNTSHSAWNFLQRHSDWFKETYPLEYNRLEDAIDFRGQIEDVEYDVLPRPWFKRIWVLQEVVVSRRCVFIQCGSRKVSWDDFCRVVLLTGRVNDQYGMSLENRYYVDLVKDIFLARSSFCIANGLDQLLPNWHTSIGDTKGRSTYLLHMLSRARALEASDPRDKIFALMGISTGVDLEDDNIAIDYHKSIGQVFQDFARYMIDHEKTYDIFGYLDQCDGAGAKPSWAPDWQKTMLPACTILDTFETESHETRQLREAMVKSSHSWVGEDWKLNLCCIGSTIGQVTFALPTSTVTRSHEDEFEAIIEDLKSDVRKTNEGLLHMWSHFSRRYAISYFVKEDWQRERVFLRACKRSIELSLNLYGVQQECQICVDNSKEIRLKIDESDEAHSEIGENDEAHSAIGESDEAHLEIGESDEAQLEIGESDGAHSEIDESDEAHLHDVQKLLTETGGTTKLKSLDPSRAALQPWPFTLDSKGHPLPNSVEAHLLKRSRRTVEWGQYGGYNAVVVDKSSIVDSRTLVRFKSDLDGDAIALAPASVRPNDRIIMLKGARLPFVVRFQSALDQSKSSLAGRLPKQKVLLLGECLINGFERFDSVYQGTHSKMAKEVAFVFI
jgi:hypothetical protein